MLGLRGRILASIHGREQGGGVVIDRALMDYMLISINTKNRLLDVHVHRGAVRGISDHYLVKGKMRVAERRRPMRGVAVRQTRIEEDREGKWVLRLCAFTQKVLEYQGGRE